MKNLYELRKRAGLTQADLSSRTGINRCRLVYAEGGYQLSGQEETKILSVIARAVEENTASVRRVIEDRTATLATA